MRSAPDLLREAAALIEQAFTQMDLNEVACRCCGLKKARNKEHMVIHRALHEVPRRLRGHAASLTHIQGAQK